MSTDSKDIKEQPPGPACSRSAGDGSPRDPESSVYALSDPTARMVIASRNQSSSTRSSTSSSITPSSSYGAGAMSRDSGFSYLSTDDVGSPSFFVADESLEEVNEHDEENLFFTFDDVEQGGLMTGEGEDRSDSDLRDSRSPTTQPIDIPPRRRRVQSMCGTMSLPSSGPMSPVLFQLNQFLQGDARLSGSHRERLRISLTQVELRAGHGGEYLIFMLCLHLCL